MDFIYSLYQATVQTFTHLLRSWILHQPALATLTGQSPVPLISGLIARTIAVMELRGRITVFSIVGCPHCMQAKSTLQELGLPYTNISLDSYPNEREWVREKTGKSTVPQIFFNALHIGGNSELQKLVSTPLRVRRDQSLLI